MENKQLTPEHIGKAIAMFKTDEEIQDDFQFRNNLYSVLDECKDRPEPPQGMHYKRGAWDYFIANSLFFLQPFLDLYNNDRKRRGEKNPMCVREYAKAIMSEAVRRTIMHYAQIEANK